MFGSCILLQYQHLSAHECVHRGAYKSMCGAGVGGLSSSILVDLGKGGKVHPSDG